MSERRGRAASRDAGPDTFTIQDADTATEMQTPHLVHLRTKAESRSRSALLQVWTVELPVKAANSILITIKESIPDQDSIELQHLRRFAKPHTLPLHLQPPGTRSNSEASKQSTGSKPSTISVESQAIRPNSANSRPSTSDGPTSRSSSNASSKSRSKSKSRSRSRSRRRRSSASNIMHLIVCPASVITFEDLTALLGKQPVFAEENFPLKIKEVTVPMLAPISQEQAYEWTTQYWPTMYRKTNPFGPHPSMVTRATEDLTTDGSAEKFMAIARQAANDSKEHGLGLGVGCVIVERRDGKEGQVVAVAGDARCCGSNKCPPGQSTSAGNVAAHAVLRAISMVARKRVRVASPKTKNPNSVPADDLLIKPVAHKQDCPESVVEALLDYPLTTCEKFAFDKTDLIPNGYLCVDLEVYITHEPCLMCSMAIVHSRFSRCIFGQRMGLSGGLVAEEGLGYGLFWRSELNWKLLCWEWKDKAEEQKLRLGEDVQV